MFNRHYPFILPDSLTQEIDTDRSSGRTDAERTIQGTCFWEDYKSLSMSLSFSLLFKHTAYHLGHSSHSSRWRSRSLKFVKRTLCLKRKRKISFFNKCMNDYKVTCEVQWQRKRKYARFIGLLRTIRSDMFSSIFVEALMHLLTNISIWKYGAF